MNPLARLVTVAAVAASLAGCSAAPAKREPRLLLLADEAVIGKTEWQAREQNLVSCMKREGFTYFPVPFAVPSTVDRYLSIPMSKRELVVRRAKGYGVAERQRFIVETQKLNKNFVYLQSLAAADGLRYSKLLIGDIASGAPGKCRVPMTSGQMARMSRPLMVAEESKVRFATNDVARSLGLNWKKCMSSKGFAEFGMPWELNLGEEVDVLGDGYEKALSQELAIAKADADCLSPHFDELNRIREKAELAAEQNVPD
jgi:hypothetical protein